jgi:hypothetical protein
MPDPAKSGKAMAKSVARLADALGATVVAELPRSGGGAFGAARLARIVGDLQHDLVPSRGKRPGRPTMSGWSLRPKVPMSRATKKRLVQLARQASTPNREVSPMQVAARLLEEALAALPTR